MSWPAKLAAPANKLADFNYNPVMAKHSSSILELAARGARYRYQELQTELALLVRQFPELRKGAGTALRRGRMAVAGAADGLQPRKRRKLSAKARKAIGDAQRKRWAKVKAAKA
jgi:hypothetical protein